MSNFQNMTVRDLIAALAEAEDASRLARRSAAASSLATLTAREDLIVRELRRRSADSEGLLLPQP